MVFIILVSVFLAIRLDISRDKYVMANSVLGITLLVFDFILMLSVVFGSYWGMKTTWVFTLMIVSVFFSNLCTVFISETYGMAEYSRFIHWMNSLSFLSAAVYNSALCMYIRTLDGGQKRPDIAKYIICVLLMQIYDPALPGTCQYPGFS